MDWKNHQTVMIISKNIFFRHVYVYLVGVLDGTKPTKKQQCLHITRRVNFGSLY
jgi:hypothetical protein